MKWAVVMVDDVLRVRRSFQRTTASLIDTVLSHRPVGHAGWLECILAGGCRSARPQWYRVHRSPAESTWSWWSCKEKEVGSGAENIQGGEVAAQAWGPFCNHHTSF